MPHQSARVDAADADQPVGFHVVVHALFGLTVRVVRRVGAHDQSGDVGRSGFGVALVGAVVADVRVGHRHDLAVVAGIGRDFLVAGHARVEADLAAGLADSAERVAVGDEPVFEGKNGGDAIGHSGEGRVT